VGTLQVVRGGRHVVDGLDPDLLRNGEEPFEPHAGVDVALLGFLVEIVARLDWLVLVAMVGFIVAHDDLTGFAAAAEIAQGAINDLVGCLDEGVDLLAGREDLAGVRGDTLHLLGGAR
jgi:hypothetical protein